jgi:hypothetical protein
MEIKCVRKAKEFELTPGDVDTFNGTVSHLADIGRQLEN